MALYYKVLYSAVLWCTLQCSAKDFIELHCVHNNTLQCSALKLSLLNYIALCCADPKFHDHLRLSNSGTQWLCRYVSEWLNCLINHCIKKCTDHKVYFNVLNCMFSTYLLFPCISTVMYWCVLVCQCISIDIHWSTNRFS